MKINAPLFKPLNSVQFISVNAGISLLILIIFFRDAFNSTSNFIIGLIWSFAIVTTQWMGPIIIHLYLDKRIKWMEKPITRSLIELVTLVIWSVTAFTIVQTVMYFILHGMMPAESFPAITRSILITFLIALFLSVLFTAIGFFKAWRRSVLKEAQLSTEMMAYKYEALKNQINPHFLFNSFNVLSDLVYTDQEQAVKFIRQLSNMFHYVLRSRDKELVSLKEELEFIESYVSLLKTRFGDKLRIDISAGSTDGYYVVPVTIQLLIENAVKHNEVSEKYPLNVSLKREGSYIVISNPVRQKQTGEETGKTGLRNIIQQYRFFTTEELEIKNNGSMFTVKVPLLTKIAVEAQFV